MEYIINMDSAALSIAVSTQKNIENGLFANLFVPSGVVALSHFEKNIDISKDFLLYLLGSEIQEVSLYDGFSVNRYAFKKWMQEENETYFGDMQGTSIDFSYG